jgi:site-specific DNA-methyltransferase (adenine-specific)
MDNPRRKNQKISKIMIYRDHFQNYKSYAIPKAQLIIADIPYNLGNNAYASNPAWYKDGDNSNGESHLAGKSFFDTDEDFRPAEFMHFCSTMLKSEPKTQKKEGEARKKSEAPCMIVFCAFDQQMYLIELAKRYGLNNYINLVFRKNFSAQVLKANMKIVGNCEYGLIFYRDKLPKFRNKGKMIFNCIDWPRDNESEKIHPTQKPVGLLKNLISIFTDEGDVVIDPCAGSGSTLIAAERLNRKAYGFEIKKVFYEKAKNWLESEKLNLKEIKELGYSKSRLEKINPILF